MVTKLHSYNKTATSQKMNNYWFLISLFNWSFDRDRTQHHVKQKHNRKQVFLTNDANAWLAGPLGLLALASNTKTEWYTRCMVNGTVYLHKKTNTAAGPTFSSLSYRSQNEQDPFSRVKPRNRFVTTWLVYCRPANKMRGVVKFTARVRLTFQLYMVWLLYCRCFLNNMLHVCMVQ